MYYYDDEFWRKKKDIPNICPKGHRERIPGKTLDSLLAHVYTGPYKTRKFDKDWKMYKWVQFCGMCSMEEELRSSKGPSFFDCPEGERTVNFSMNRTKFKAYGW